MTYTKREIMTVAHGYRTSNNLNMSNALQAAWLSAKIARLETIIENLSYADRLTLTERKLNDTARFELNYLVSQFNKIIPPVLSEKVKLQNLQEEMMRTAWIKSDNVTYYKLKKMDNKEFAEYIAETKVA